MIDDGLPKDMNYELNLGGIHTISHPVHMAGPGGPQKVTLHTAKQNRHLRLIPAGYPNQQLGIDTNPTIEERQSLPTGYGRFHFQMRQSRSASK